jgi:hypothetical protein
MNIGIIGQIREKHMNIGIIGSDVGVRQLGFDFLNSGHRVIISFGVAGHAPDPLWFRHQELGACLQASQGVDAVSLFLAGTRMPAGRCLANILDRTINWR